MNLNSNNEYTVYLTSLGSEGYFPDNTFSQFKNILSHPLTNMQNYKVGLAACHIPGTADTVLVCLDIVTPTFFNDKQLPIVGACSGYFGDILHTYANLSVETVTSIGCTLLDVHGQPISLRTVPLIILHFMKK